MIRASREEEEVATAAGPIAAYRRYWLPEAVILLLLGAATAAVFGWTDLDIDAAHGFYRPGIRNRWPVADRPVWRVFHASAPFVTASLALAGTIVLAAGVVRAGASRLRLHGLFLLLCVILGPGLVVNAILKDHWGRPRPRQILEFGGHLPHATPLLPAGSHGKSFPCGHCSVGYLYGIGWWIWRRSRPALAAASLGIGLGMGTMLGLGRIAAGGHFLSDVVWSGLIAFGVAHLLYFHVMRIPAREDARGPVFPLLERRPRLRAAAVAATVFVGAGVVGGGILASPQHEDLGSRFVLADLPVRPERLEVIVETCDIELRLIDGADEILEVTGEIHGFGLPTNEIEADWEYEAEPVPTARFRIVERGWFTDLDGVGSFRVPVGSLRRIVVRVACGDILVAGGEGRIGELPERIPELDLRTEDGELLGW